MLSVKSLILCKIARIEHLQELQKGRIYMKNLKFHRDNAVMSPNSNLGDADEGIVVKSLKNIEIFMDNIKIGEAENLNAWIMKKCPIFCALIMNFTKTENADYEYIPDKRLINDFINGDVNDYGVLITCYDEFRVRCEKVLDRMELPYCFSHVVYDDKNPKFPKEEAFKYVFRKREELSYQNECRLLIETNIESDGYFELNIGDFSANSIILPASDFLNGKIKFKPNSKFKTV